MLINDKFVFLQLQKTGCTHIEKTLFALFSDTQQYGKHYRLPENFAKERRIVFGSVRNPWDWYLSYWTYSCLQKGGPYKRSVAKRGLRNIISNPRLHNGHGELKPSLHGYLKHFQAELTRPVSKWRYLYEDVNDPSRFREWLKLVLSYERRFDLFQDYGMCEVSEITGLYTYLFLFLYADDLQVLSKCCHSMGNLKNLPLVTDYLIRTEHLNEDFIGLLTEQNINTPKEVSDSLKIKTNTSNRSHSKSFYYDDECRKLVEHKEQYIVDKFGYRFE